MSRLVWLSGVNKVRLAVCVTLCVLLCLCGATLWTYHLRHYRYVIKNTLTSDRLDLSTHNYAIVIDAGSSSSKVHLFHWPPHDGDPHKLLTIHPLTDPQGQPLTKKVEPGISRFASTPAAAFNSLIPLLEYASSQIPPHKHPHTVLYVLGTAGMRMLPVPQQEAMMEHLSTTLSRDYSFYQPKDSIQVISGQMEGVFSWITVNYLLGNFSPERHSLGDTVGVLDMGGASMQIAFEVSEDEFHSERIVDINLGCGHHENGEHKHRVYSTTYLGYGSNTARSNYYTALATQFNTSTTESVAGPSLMKDPCAQQGLTENVTLSDKRWLVVRGGGDYSSCKTALHNTLLSSPPDCTGENCNNQLTTPFQRPPGDLGYTSMDFYGTSEFWYSMRDVLGMGGTYSPAEYESRSAEFCSTEWRYVRNRFTKHLYTYANLYRLRSQCFKSAWLSVVLHEGLEFPPESVSLRTLSSLNGQTVGWPLGALLYLTRYMPLREVQLQQQLHRSTQSTHWEVHTVTNSILPLFVVLSVIVLLLVCRHRRGQQGLPLPSSSSQHKLTHTPSQMSLHHRSHSLSLLPRQQSSDNINWLV